MHRHFTATTYIFHNNKTLFLFHKKLQTWLPPGGHIEVNETPESCARREIFEEVGITELSFVDPPTVDIVDERVKTLRQPHFILAENIAIDHVHMDFIFFAQVQHTTVNSSENLRMQWFTQSEVEQLDIYANVWQMAMYGFNLLKLY